MKLYHGTDMDSATRILEEGINVLAGNPSADFGPGFYTTPNRDFAVQRAIQKSRKAKNEPVLVVVEFDEEAAKGIAKTFYKADLQWLQFIVNNRLGEEYIEKHNQPEEAHNLDGKYPIVAGKTADAKIVFLVGFIRDEGRLATEGDLWVGENPEFDTQYSFHNQYGLSFIEGKAKIEPVQIEGDE